MPKRWYCTDFGNKGVAGAYNQIDLAVGDAFEDAPALFGADYRSGAQPARRRFARSIPRSCWISAERLRWASSMAHSATRVRAVTWMVPRVDSGKPR
jgi:hypothetical protein